MSTSEAKDVDDLDQGRSPRIDGSQGGKKEEETTNGQEGKSNGVTEDEEGANAGSMVNDDESASKDAKEVLSETEDSNDKDVQSVVSNQAESKKEVQSESRVVTEGAVDVKQASLQEKEEQAVADAVASVDLKNGEGLPDSSPAQDKSQLKASTADSTSVQAASPSGSSSLQPETMQHRHTPGTDKPASYQPSVPNTYLHLKALALQLPSQSSSGQQSSSHHIDPPTLLLEGRTNLSTARRSFYPRVTRTLPELQLWILALTLSFPAGIFSPFTYPPSSLVSGGNADDATIRSYLVTISNQFARILRKPYVLSHPATVALVDCDFSYNPGLPHVGPGTSVSARRKLEDGISMARSGHDPLRGRKAKGGGVGPSVTATWDVDGVAAALGLPSLPSQASGDTYGAQQSAGASKGPLSIFTRANSSPQRIQPVPSVPIPPGEEDQDEEELTAARNEITRLELQFEKASRAAQILVEQNGAMTSTLHQLNTAMTDLARLDEGRAVARKARQSEDMATLSKGLESWQAAQSGANGALLSTLVPSMSYQSLNARAAIDALLRRAAAANHRHSALVVLVQKRREAERLKRARGEIRQEDVDWVLQELRDAQRTTQVLTHHLTTFTATLKEELKEHSRNTHTDIQTALLQHARSSVRAQKVMLNNLIRARDGLVALREGKPVDKAVTSPKADHLVVDSSLEAHESSTAASKGDDGSAEKTMPTDAETERKSSATTSQALVDDAHSTVNANRQNDLIDSNTSQQAVQGPETSLGASENTGSKTDGDQMGNEDQRPVENASLPPPPPPQQQQQQSPVEGMNAQADPVRPPPQVQEPSPWSAGDATSTSAWTPKAPPSPAEPSPWAAQSSVPPLGMQSVEPSPWAEQEENRLGDAIKPSLASQSAFLPPRMQGGFEDEDTSSPFSASGGPPSETHAYVTDRSSMAQSAFLPGRDMSRYANPFARMDGSASTSAFGGVGRSGGGSGSAVNGSVKTPQRNPFGEPSSFVNPEQQQRHVQSPSADAGESERPKGKPANNPWANRSRISASDAARNLAGRF